MDIGDIAARAGVSRSTVSYALSGKRPISAATRERIEQVIKDAGYVPNPAAQALKRGSMRTLGFVMPPADHHHLTGGQLEMIGAAVVAAADANYDVLLSAGSREGEASFQRLIRQRRVDGMLLSETRVKDPRVAAVAKAGLPFVTIGRTSDRPRYDWVDIDHDHLVRICVRHLVDQGCRHIALMNRSPALVNTGYGPSARSSRALQDEGRLLGVTVSDLSCEDNLNGAPEFVDRLLREHAGIDGIITINETALPGLMPALSAAGRRVPDDIAVCGIASASLAEAVRPALTACDNPVLDLSVMAVRLLIDRLAGSDVHTHTLVAPDLTVRDSTRRLRQVSA